MWSMCACVITMAFTRRPWRATMRSISGQVVARIDHQGVARLLVAENGAVALQHAHRQDLMHHK
jgi:hypothetical protein